VNTVCEAGPNHFPFGVYSDAVQSLNSYYQGISNIDLRRAIPAPPKDNPRNRCLQLTCKGTVGVFVCNDVSFLTWRVGVLALLICNQNNRDIDASYRDLVAATTQVINQCRRMDTVVGQIFTNDGWNIIVRGLSKGEAC
jgi:hypothetical protein